MSPRRKPPKRTRTDYQTYSMDPAFIDALAVDVVVQERRYLKLTSAEKRHAAHRLQKQGMTTEQVARILKVTDRTVARMWAQPPPPILDIDEDGQYVSVEDDRLAV